MARIQLPQLFVLFPKIWFFLSILACGNLNATLLTAVSLETEQTYVGCYRAWHKMFIDGGLKAPEGQQAYDHINGPSICAGKCIREDTPAKFIFLRGVECRCAFDITSIEQIDANAIHLVDEYCDVSCQRESCGGNIAYSVYCVSSVSSNDDCNSSDFQSRQQSPINKMREIESTLERNANRYPHPVPDMTCGLCNLDGQAGKMCSPLSLSPAFNYFPLNNANECANFCDTDIDYVEWNPDEVRNHRPPTLYAVLLWWIIPNSVATPPIPVCVCVDTKDKFVSSPGLCNTMRCPNGSKDSCGGISSDNSVIFGSVYCIENGSGRCGPIPTTTTTMTTVSSSISSTSTCDNDPPVTYQPTTTEITQPVTTTHFQSTSTFTTTTFPGTTVTRESQSTTITTASDSTTTPLTDSTSNSTFPTTTVTSGSPTTTTPIPDIVDEISKHCFGKDRHGTVWKEDPNSIASKDCSDLISDSTGQAYWTCNGITGNFEPEQPNTSNCSSSWVRLMESKLAGVNNTDNAIDSTFSLLIGCKNQSHRDSKSKYYGKEIKKIIVLVGATLKKVSVPENPLRRSGKKDGFEELVVRAIDVNACLVNSAEPWEDLLPLEKSSLSTKLMDATEDVLFHFTQYKYVEPNQGYRKEFTPMDQFTAVAEVFAKAPNSPTYEYDQLKCDREGKGKSCVKLPPGWTRELEDKVEIAIITIEPESVAKVMTGTGVYEVNGQRHKILNGRLISFSVTSSSMNVKSEFHGVRSKSLNFSDKGIEIYFPHIVDAYGDQIYKIPRKLHKGEKPRAAMGSAQCVNWEASENMWSTRGCKLLKTSRLETVCECSQLTSFAVLMDVHRYDGKQRALEILTLILCPLSELSLLLTIIILSSSRNHAHKVRTTICTHLSLCLFIGNAMILLVLDRNYLYLSDGVCMGAAMATHYVFLCAFMWMLFEGVQLYRVVIHVFDSGRSYVRQFGILAYGTPMIIISITAAVGHIKGDKPYGGEPYCWLLGNYIWTFMVPVGVVITVNLIVLFIALKTSVQLQNQRQREIKLSPHSIMEKILSYRVHFKGCFTLTVIMGLTWIVGFFTLMEGQSKLTAAYLFTILNASQGFFIFVFTCHTYIHNGRLFTRRKLSNIPSSNVSPVIKRKPRGKLVLTSGRF